jgi:hypothetical protein
VLIITLLLGFSNKFSGVNYTPAKQQSLDAPEQPELSPVGSPPTLATTPPAAPPGHGMVTHLRDNTCHEKKYTDGTVWYNP